jgi:hypothetical protein
MSRLYHLDLLPYIYRSEFTLFIYTLEILQLQEITEQNNDDAFAMKFNHILIYLL